MRVVVYEVCAAAYPTVEVQSSRHDQGRTRVRRPPDQKRAAWSMS
jgi:hypothetical protein